MKRAFPLALLVLAACDDEEMGVFEALAALGQVNESARGEQATSEVVEVSTDFTIGDAVIDAAQAIGDFWESQAPCTVVTTDGALVTIDYGTLDDDCVYNHHTYAGVNTVEVVDTTLGSLQVEHTWNGFSNGDVQVDGGAEVTWSGADLSRRVVTDHTWTDLKDPSNVVEVHGDHVTAPMETGVTFWDFGFTLDGTREWTTEGETWSLEMADMELRMLDPAPQAGTVDLIAPNGKTLTIAYDRVDEDTISATLIGVRGGDRVYHISRLGQVEEADAAR
ncbi:MAG: hypothetical protein H6735_28190 [Alphaproteobacteria bacterium]|nr:hypothetical protein [Alphaproteobacteria bacterium]